MGLTLRQRLATALLLVSSQGVNSYSSSLHPRHVETGLPEPEACPPCELLFSKLEEGGRDGKLTQVVEVQERGEPKSGTGFMYFWATATFIRTCRYLQGLYGEKSCRVEFNMGRRENGLAVDRTFNRTLVFEPGLAGGDSRCSCDTIDSVSIVLSKFLKHTLPVDSSCAYSHGGGMDLVIVEEHAGKTACRFTDGTKVENKDDLWRCMHEANCEITDDWLQMAVFRDPRPAVVSSYFHREVQGSKHVGQLEDFIIRELPILCQWLAIRYILFNGLIPHQSVAFWYNEAIADPVQWHYDWFNSIGLQLPPQFVLAAANAAVADDLGFRHKDIDVHPGEQPRPTAGVRRFEDEVSPAIVQTADAVLRVWLPPVLLEKFGVAP